MGTRSQTVSSPHAVVAVLLVQSDEEADIRQVDDHVARQRQVAGGPLDLKHNTLMSMLYYILFKFLMLLLYRMSKIRGQT